MDYFAIGDIHGRYDLLEDLLKQAKAKYPKHKLVFLGDMVDRGKDSFKVVQTIKRLTEKEGAIALLGNHDDEMLKYYGRRIVDKMAFWCRIGGLATIESYCKAAKMYGYAKFFPAFEKSGHIQWMKDLPIYYETDEVWFSHAPIPEQKWRWPEHQTRDIRHCKHTCTWPFHGNYGVEEDVFARDHGKLAVCGHIHAVKERIFTPRAYKAIDKDYHKIVYADTGCGCWRSAPLTGVVIEGGKMVGYLQATVPNEEVLLDKAQLAFLKAWESQDA